jgi:hypothetical protein
MKLYDMIYALITLLMADHRNKFINIKYPVVRAIVRRYPEASILLDDVPVNHEEVLLPTGAKVVKTKRRGRVAYFLSTYAWNNVDGIKILNTL